MLTISRVHELALPDWRQAGLLHELAYLVAPDLQAAIGKHRNQTAAAVTLATAHECCTQMHASFAKSRRDGTALGFIKSSPVYVKKTAGLCDRYGLRLQLVDEPVAHLSSRAKKVDAFLIRPHHYEADGFPAPTVEYAAAQPSAACQYRAGHVAQLRTVPSSDGSSSPQCPSTG